MKKKRGFAGMSSEKQRAIASLGGVSAHKQGTAHEFNSTEARVAGRKGGAPKHKRNIAGSDKK
jgi:hypothetical protein